ncbi:M1 family metallopeptidase [Streptomyces sp. NRRL S-495]|uniref:M1 family metallopeptidase n=1 Tax=Streptomyces sp. NRRL S-495 TaxID=1609133 RepID=UPI0005F99CBF|nr:M1 family metallopeptidase [Streptomyces sp. NRRL S-495]KJY31851.1 zinc metalloprotease [Streptomyces sp. NRRL S-495]
MSWHRSVLAAALALAAVPLGLAPAAADSPGAGPPGTGDPVFPALGTTAYDAHSYDLAFTYRPTTRTVDATMAMTARARTALPSLELDALGLDVHAVRVDGRPAGFRTHDEKLTVVPARPVRAGAPLRVEVEYTADPRAALPHTGWVVTPDGFAVAGQPDGAHTVFPCNDRPGDKARFTVAVTAPDELYGELLQASVGRYTVRERQGPDGLPLRDVVPTARAADLEPALALTPGQLGWAEQHLGPFPFETYGLLPADTDDPAAFDFTGLETQTLTLYKPNFLRQPERQIGSHMMHELVHSWFGNSVTPGTWADLWLNEGHADFYGLMYRYERGWPDSGGFTTLADRMRSVYAQGDQWRHDSGPVAAPTAATLFDSQRYTGGALVLFALRERVGPEVFDRIEQVFLRRHRSSTATTADFLRTADEVSGQSLGGFLRDWLYGERTPPMPGHPDWTVDPVDPGAARRTGGVPKGSGTL